MVTISANIYGLEIVDEEGNSEACSVTIEAHDANLEFNFRGDSGMAISSGDCIPINLEELTEALQGLGYDLKPIGRDRVGESSEDDD